MLRNLFDGRKSVLLENTLQQFHFSSWHGLFILILSGVNWREIGQVFVWHFRRTITDSLRVSTEPILSSLVGHQRAFLESRNLTQHNRMDSFPRFHGILWIRRVRSTRSNFKFHWPRVNVVIIYYYISAKFETFAWKFEAFAKVAEVIKLSVVALMKLDVWRDHI